MPSQLPQVSVIVPCYNYGRFLGPALDSVRAQTLTDWECIVVDDGSTDDTPAVAARHAAQDPRIRYVHQPNGGPSAARNRGLAEARGRWVQLLDADDLLQPRKLERQAAYLEAHPDVDIVYGDFRCFTSETAAEALRAPLSLAETLPPDGDLTPLLMRRNHIVTPAALFRRRLLETLLGFDLALPAAEDWDFWLRAALAGARFHGENWEAAQTLVRQHDASYSRDRRRMLESYLLLRRKLEGLTDDPPLKALNRRMRFEEEAALGKHEVLFGRLGRGLRLLLRAGVQAGTPKWLLYALLLPLLRPRPLQRLLPSLGAAWARLCALR